MARRPGTLTPVVEKYVQSGLRGQRRDAVLQATNDVEDVEAAVLMHGRRESEGQPDGRAVVHDVDAGRHDADDFVWPSLDGYGLSNEVVPSQDGLPQVVRKNRERERQTAGMIGFVL